MFKSQKYELHGRIDGWNLMWCMRVIAYIEQPPFIPFYEQMTFRQIAEYFSVPETRVRNAYKTNQYDFKDDMCVISGKELAESAVMVQNLGRHYGNLLTFANGVKIQAAHSANTMFNARALLHFAVYLCEESEVAKKIADTLWEATCNPGVLGHARVPALKPWFTLAPHKKASQATPGPKEETFEFSDLVKQVNAQYHSDRIQFIVVAAQ